MGRCARRFVRPGHMGWTTGSSKPAHLSSYAATWSSAAMAVRTVAPFDATHREPCSRFQTLFGAHQESGVHVDQSASSTRESADAYLRENSKRASVGDVARTPAGASEAIQASTMGASC